jgi:citrate lyase subunit beta/citryl-CoA lyase
MSLKIARRRRSCLTVPADDERKLARAATIAADEVIVDLEDAVAPERKSAAREIALRALRDLDWMAATVAVRVNGARTSWHADDVALVRAANPAVVVVPKVESLEELAGLPVPCEALIETARGLVGCEAIAAAPGLEALVFGPGDLAASLGVPELTIGEGAHSDYALARILVAARAAGVSAIDGPYPHHRDSEGFRASAQRSRAFGYDGKWCIHPAQVELANEVYAPTAEELERAQRILEHAGVASIDGEMIDEANRRMAEAIVARAC